MADSGVSFASSMLNTLGYVDDVALIEHGCPEGLKKLPEGFKLMASTPSCPIAGMANEEKHYYAVQFHPEVTHTVQGQRAARCRGRRACPRAPTAMARPP